MTPNPSISACPACQKPLKYDDIQTGLGVCCFCGTVLVILSAKPLKLREAMLNDLIDLTAETHARIDEVQRRVRCHEVEPGNPS